jgi:hypothetical protein
VTIPPRDDAFLAALESQAVPLGEWSHHCHLRMAYVYPRARLMTWEAKRAFVEPDLLPLPGPN